VKKLGVMSINPKKLFLVVALLLASFNGKAAGQFVYNGRGNFQDTTLPTITSGDCGTTTNGSITSGGTGISFNVVIGSATTTSCKIHFGQTWPYTPKGCVAYPANSASAALTVLPYIAHADLAATYMILRGTALTSTTFNIMCQ
jgi:hypothetical protein